MPITHLIKFLHSALKGRNIITHGEAVGYEKIKKLAPSNRYIGRITFMAQHRKAMIERTGDDRIALWHIQISYNRSRGLTPTATILRLSGLKGVCIYKL